METPLFLSVVIPVLNRERLVLRAIASALANAGNDVEVIVVDDGSTDRTAEHVAAIDDPRVKLIRLPENGGQCPARNRGAAIASGEWLVFLDSDDELVPGGLDKIRARARTAPPGVAKLLFACRDDAGVISPRPLLDGRVIDYDGYLRWLEETNDGASETLPCTRREEFMRCPYPEKQNTAEGIHELDFVSSSLVQLCPDVVRLYHWDAPNRLTANNAVTIQRRARGIAEHASVVLARHGEALRRSAPHYWTKCTREAALSNFLAGERGKGMRYSFAVLRHAPSSVRTWVALGAGMLGPNVLGQVWSIKRWWATA